MENKLIYFDTETTDLQSKDIVQIALMKENGETLNLYFKPNQEISCSAMAVHNLTPEFLSSFKSFEDTELPKEYIDPEFTGTSLVEYLQFLAEEKIWVAHNSEFDVEVLRRKGIEIKQHICTFKIARNMLETGGMDLESYSLQYLRYYLGLYKNENGEHNIAHDALSDVYFLRDLFVYLRDNSKLSVENMITISREPAMIRNINFGKYAGKSLDDIAKEDRGYLEWLRENLTEKEDLQWNIDRVLATPRGTLFD